MLVPRFLTFLPRGVLYMAAGGTSTKAPFVDNSRKVYQVLRLWRGRACKFAGKAGDIVWKRLLRRWKQSKDLYSDQEPPSRQGQGEDMFQTKVKVCVSIQGSDKPIHKEISVSWYYWSVKCKERSGKK